MVALDSLQGSCLCVREQSFNVHGERVDGAKVAQPLGVRGGGRDLGKRDRLERALHGGKASRLCQAARFLSRGDHFLGPAAGRDQSYSNSTRPI